MREELLHYIWKFQQFDASQLSYAQEPISIFNPGIHNHDAGPDFKDAHIKIGKLEWRGSVEIHVKSAEWHAHRHTEDPSYNNTILHVVWTNNADVYRNDGTLIPYIELKNRVPLNLLKRYEKLSTAPEQIPCTNSAGRVPAIKRLEMVEKTAIERLKRKSHYILQLLNHLQGDWEVCAYHVLLRAFGFKINQEATTQLAQHLPLSLLKKHAASKTELESLLFGQAGLLTKEPFDHQMEEYCKQHSFFQKKYNLNSTLQGHQWKRLRLRPANFPTVRLAQFAALISASPYLFDQLISYHSYKKLKSVFTQPVSPYWQEHYDFAKRRKGTGGNLGDAALHLIVINSIAPFMAAYGLAMDQNNYLEQALHILEEMKPEQNRKTRKMNESGFEIKNALHSQGLLELFDQYCTPRNCLRCSVGNHLLKSDE